MRFNGIGEEHGAQMHHVTNCMHEHAHYKKEEDVGKASASQTAAQRFEAQKQQGEGQLSLSAWLEKTFRSGKRLLLRVWAGSESGDGAESRRSDLRGSESGTETAARAPGVLETAQAAAAVAPFRSVEDNPYFSAVAEREKDRPGVWQRMRVRLKGTAGQLAGHLPGNFFNAQTNNSFQAGKERSREDLRKHSKFRKDELEIDCILTDDSYLLDSYDRKGEYSKLSTKK